MSTTAAEYSARMVAQRAARQAGATMPANKPPIATPTPAPIVPNAAPTDYAALSAYYLDEMAQLAAVAAVARIRVNAGLENPPITDAAKRIIANAEAAGVREFDASRRNS